MLRRLLAAILLAGSVSLAGCSSHSGTGPTAAIPDQSGRIPFEIPAAVSTGAAATFPSDPLEIVGDRADADTLVIDVRYGGGCVDHAFILIGSAAFAESNPVQTFMTLAHDARGDLCKALVFKTLRADITPLRDAYRRSYQVEHGTISIRLTGAPPILYRF